MAKSPRCRDLPTTAGGSVAAVVAGAAHLCRLVPGSGSAADGCPAGCASASGAAAVFASAAALVAGMKGKQYI